MNEAAGHTGSPVTLGTVDCLPFIIRIQHVLGPGAPRRRFSTQGNGRASPWCKLRRPPLRFTVAAGPGAVAGYRPARWAVRRAVTCFVTRMYAVTGLGVRSQYQKLATKDR